MLFDRVNTIGRCDSVGGGHQHRWQNMAHLQLSGESQSFSKLALCHLVVFILLQGVAVIISMNG